MNETPKNNFDSDIANEFAGCPDAEATIAGMQELVAEHNLSPSTPEAREVLHHLWGVKELGRNFANTELDVEGLYTLLGTDDNDEVIEILVEKLGIRSEEAIAALRVNLIVKGEGLKLAPQQEKRSVWLKLWKLMNP